MSLPVEVDGRHHSSISDDKQDDFAGWLWTQLTRQLQLNCTKLTNIHWGESILFFQLAMFAIFWDQLLRAMECVKEHSHTAGTKRINE
jgi:hypothetical protein